MLGKVLGVVTAGVFVGAAAVEISGYLDRDRAGKKLDLEVTPATADTDVKASKENDETETKTES